MYLHGYQGFFFLMIFLFLIISLAIMVFKNDMLEKKLDYLKKENLELKFKNNVLATQKAKESFYKLQRKEEK